MALLIVVIMIGVPIRIVLVIDSMIWQYDMDV
jgi:hypothetical protein